MNRVLRGPLHPFLFGFYVVLFVFAQNVDKVDASEVVFPVAVITGLTVVLLVVLRPLSGSWRRAALVTTTTSVLFFSYGHITGAVRQAMAASRLDADEPWLVIWGLVGLIGIAAVIRSRSDVAGATVVVNLVCVLLIAMTIPSIADGAIRQWREAPIGAAVGVRTQDAAAATKRDIYYLIFDRYGSADVLREVYDFDNTPFLNALRQRGFYVPVRTNANYPKTNLSLASSLNMEYLDRFPRDSTNLKPVSAAMRGSRVASFLQSQGYTYVFIGSRYWALREDRAADVNHRFRVGTIGPVWNGLTQALYEYSLLNAVGERPDLEEVGTDRRIAYEHPFFAMERLHEVAAMPETTFTFSHLAFPHDPYVADELGRYKTLEASEAEGRVEGLVDQVRLLNTMILDLVDELLNVPEPERPIIILQADEGQWPVDWRSHWPPKRTARTSATLTEKFGVLNAYHLPGPDDAELYETITPVNSFRVIFNAYFGTDLPLLPDDSYVFPSLDEPFAFLRVTDDIGRF